MKGGWTMDGVDHAEGAGQPYFERLKVRLGDLVLIGGEKHLVTGTLNQSDFLKDCVVPIEFTPLIIPEMVALFHEGHLKGLKVLGHYAPDELAALIDKLRRDAAANSGTKLSFK